MRRMREMHSYQYKIIKELNLFIELYSGMFSPENYIAFLQKNIHEKQEYNVFIDITTLTVDEKSKAFSSFTQYLKDHLDIVSAPKTAILTKTPKQVVIATLIKDINPRLSCKIEVFSTFRAAIEWFGIEKSESNIVYKEIVELKSGGIIQ